MNSGNSKKYINKNRLRLLEEYDMLFKKYARSCSIISKYRLIPFELYKRHMKKLIILLHFIHQIYRITFKKNMPQFNMFDHQIMQRYNNADKIDGNFVYFSVPIYKIGIVTRVDPQNLIPIAYNYNNAPDSMFILRFSDSNTHSQSYSKSDKQKGCVYNEYNEKILYSTIIHRCIRLSFKGNKILFNGELERKYMDATIDNLEYAKYMSILPSHITLNIVNFAEDDINIIPFFDNNIRGILQKINVLHRDFQEDYSIMYYNKNFQNQFNNIIGYCDDENTIKTIIYTINNNNNNNIKKDYYYWFEYNSPLPATTILDTETYVFGIHTLQPLNMSKLQLSNIKLNYIGTREPYSKIVNVSLQNYIANGLVMEKEAYKRVRYLLKFCSDTTYNIERNKKTIYVFHGSHRDFHSDYNSDIVLTSFLSCTFNINVALRYAYENRKNNGVVYIIEIKDEIKYINFNDEFHQIILPPGLKIIVSKVLVVGNVKYNFCKVYNHEDKEYIDILYNNIFEGGKGRLKLYNIKNYKIYNDKDNYPQTIRIQDDIQSRDTEYSFICLGTQINEDVSFNTFFNVKYTLHQHFINECYKFFKINVVDYAIYYGTDNFYTVFKNDDNYEIINEQSREYENFGYNFENLFIDSLLHNEEALYPRNYMKNKKRRFEYKLYSLRGAGLFDYEGFKKINYNIHEHSKLYMNIVLGYISRIQNNLYINDITKQYLELLINKNIGDFKLFRDDFIDMLKDNYINFIDVNMNIDKTTEEYNELVTMFEELVAIMKLNADYYINNMENGSIYKEVEPYIYDHKKTGGGEMRTNTNVHKALKTLKTLKTLNTPYIKNTEKDLSFTTYDNKGYAISNDDYIKFINRIKKT